MCIVILTSNDVALARWEYDVLDLPSNIINNQTPIKIAIIDSGVIDSDYLRPYMAQGYNFIDSNTDTTDNHGHGTKITGIMVDLAKETGLNVQLIPLKVFDTDGIAPVANVLMAIDYATRQNVDVINISLVGYNLSQEYIDVLSDAIKHNIPVVAGVGNNGKNEYLYPSSYKGVISAGSINQGKENSWFSNYNDKIDVVSPGEDVTVMNLDGSYKLHYGTSYSTSFTTFEIALLKSYYPNLSVDEITKIVDETAIDKGEVGYDVYYGNGIINYKNAIDSAEKAFDKYSDWETHSGVQLDKSWTIKFNDAVKTIGEVYIMDEYYNIIPTDILIEENKVTVTPSTNYEEDTIYSLIIKNTVSLVDATLKDNIRMKFKTIGKTKIMNVPTNTDVDKMPLIIP